MPRTALLLAALFAAAPARAEAPPDGGRDTVAGGYTKFEYRVPMRDGVRLFTAVYVPKDAGPAKTYPVLLERTPYGVGPYGADHVPDRVGPSPLFQKAGYVFAYQDVRGRMKSAGAFAEARPLDPKRGPKDADESTDAYDTVDWLLKHVPHTNGKAGMIGVSYPGFYAACGLVDAHPALKAVSPQAPVTDLFDGDDLRHNGAFLLAHNFTFAAFFRKMRPDMYRRPDPGFDYGTPDGYRFFLDMGPLANADKLHLKGLDPFWTEVMKHPDYDEFCQARDVRRHLKNVKPAVLTVGGWYDAEDLSGALYTHRAVGAASPDCPENVLVMGPWTHGGWGGDGAALGPVRFRAKTGEHYREKIEFPFFEQHLKGAAPAKRPKAAVVFETGTNRWREFDTWPPADAGRVKFALAPGGKLLAPGEPTPAADGSDEYAADPAKPVPYVEKTTIQMDTEYMTADQRFAAGRPDVLTYQAPVLSEDLAVAGPVEVELRVSTTGTDADFVVKLIDVYPDDYPDPDPNPKGVRMGGYQQLVRGEPFRGKYRTSLSKPEPFEPGKPSAIKFAMPDVCHTFRAGHRVMVQVQSSWFPLIDRNPQTFCDISTATEKDFRKQTHRVHFGPSGVTLRVPK